MRIIFKIFLATISIGIVLGLLLLTVKKGYLDREVSYILKHYLSIKGIDAKFSELHIRDNKITIKKAQIILNNNLGYEITNLYIKINVPHILKNRQIKSSFSAQKFTIKNNFDQSIITVIPNGYHLIDFKNNNVYAELDLKNIDLQNQKSLDKDSGKPSSDGFGHCKYESGSTIIKNVNCELSPNDKSFFSFKAEIAAENFKLKSNIINIPIAIYKLAEKVMPESKIFRFLDEFIKAGEIEKGELNINLNKDHAEFSNLTSENLNGEFTIRDLEFKYEENFPSLKNAALDLNINGRSTKIFLKKAFSNSTLISDGIIELDWIGQKDSKVTATAYARGPVGDLTDFIPKESLERAKKADIDLKKFTSIADTKIELTIPLNPDIQNIYNITTEANNVSLKILNDNLELKDAKISGSFDGDQVLINGIGKINNFESNLAYHFKLKDNLDYDQLLRIKTKIKAQNQKIGLVKVLAGSGLFDFEYKVKGEQSIINAKADLQKTEFYIDKIAIHKLKGDKADLTISGDLKNFPNTDISFKLIGADNLEILGNIATGDGKYKLNLPSIKHKDTDIKGEIDFNKGNYSAKIEGNKLDLSNADMMHFLEKDKDSNGDSDLKIKVEKVKLKNNIFIDNLFLTIKCTKTRCYKGYLDSKIGSKFFKMLLKTFEDKEEWIITTTNTGALFRGLGLYNNMRVGTMLLILNTKRQEVKQGEIIPILDGTFTFRNFAVTDTPFLTRLVSFVSLPGLKNLFTNNKDMIFKIMNGKFSYSNNMFNISESSAEGPFLDFTLKGKIDTVKRKIDISGNVIPSMYGLSTILKNIPILGKLFSGGHRKGIIFAPYSVHQDY